MFSVLSLFHLRNLSNLSHLRLLLDLATRPILALDLVTKSIWAGTARTY